MSGGCYAEMDPGRSHQRTWCNSNTPTGERLRNLPGTRLGTNEGSPGDGHRGWIVVTACDAGCLRGETRGRGKKKGKPKGIVTLRINSPLRYRCATPEYRQPSQLRTFTDRRIARQRNSSPERIGWQAYIGGLSPLQPFLGSPTPNGGPWLTLMPSTFTFGGDTMKAVR